MKEATEITFINDTDIEIEEDPSTFSKKYTSAFENNAHFITVKTIDDKTMYINPKWIINFY